MKFNKQGNIYLPELKRSQMPQFRPRLFLCTYEEDVEKFKKLVESRQGYWEGYKEIRFLNYLNDHITNQYACIYHFHEDIDMEVMC